jgi:hypothetical protein
VTVAIEEVSSYPPAHADAIVPGLVANDFSGLIPRYGAPSWSLAALPHGPGTSRKTILWDRFPPAFREETRYLTWLLINTSLPASFLIGKHMRWRTTVSPGHVYPTVREWRLFCHWLHDTGRTSLRHCTPEDFRAYALYLATETSGNRSRAQKSLAALTRMWALDSSTPLPIGLCQPPWLSEGTDDFLPPASSSAENTTEPVTPATMGPLLIWALRVVENFSEDILRAVQLKDEILIKAGQTAPTTAGATALEQYLGKLVAAGISLPSMAAANRSGLAAKYISHITGASVRQVHKQVISGPWRDQLLSADGPAPVLTELTGHVDGLPWTEFIDYSEVETLQAHLETAAYIVVSYLTGMRPREIQGLEKGCCPEPESGSHLIHSYVFKTALDDDGNHVPQGVMREVPWVAIEPVVAAIRIVERLVPEGYLFRGFPPGTMNRRIEQFIGWVSDLARKQGRPHEAVPDDKYGAVGVSRFRRTLAWHIARRPGGLVALAIQYGHLRTTMSAGYASRSRNGVHDLLDIETALAVADTLTSLNEEITNGAGVSGPAARRAINAAQDGAEFVGAIIDARQARALLENPSLVIYDNPSAMLMCVYKPDRALCNRITNKESPSLDRCVPTCSNIARTDSQARMMRRDAESLERQATNSPGPLALRMRARACRIREEADQHDRSRTVLEVIP